MGTTWLLEKAAAPKRSRSLRSKSVQKPLLLHGSSAARPASHGNARHASHSSSKSCASHQSLRSRHSSSGLKPRRCQSTRLAASLPFFYLPPGSCLKASTCASCRGLRYHPRCFHPPVSGGECATCDKYYPLILYSPPPLSPPLVLIEITPRW